MPAFEPPQVAGVTPTRNYLVPSEGTTMAVPMSGSLTAGQPVVIDWRQFNTDSQPFQPQGVYIDNTQGPGTLTIGIYANGPSGALLWNIVVPAGKVLHTPYPAPNGQGWIINCSANNPNAIIVAVDYPVLPYGPV